MAACENSKKRKILHFSVTCRVILKTGDNLSPGIQIMYYFFDLNIF